MSLTLRSWLFRRVRTRPFFFISRSLPLRRKHSHPRLTLSPHLAHLSHVAIPFALLCPAFPMASSSDQFVLARPYPHQVGGHGELAVTNAGHVLKPLQPKEYEFYKYIHSDEFPVRLRWILDFTPKFYGEADFPNMTSPRFCSAPSSSSPHVPIPSTPLTDENPETITDAHTPVALTAHEDVAERPSATASTFPAQSLPFESLSLMPVNSATITDTTLNDAVSSQPDPLSSPCVSKIEIGMTSPLPAMASHDGVMSEVWSSSPNLTTPRWRLPNEAAHTEVSVSPWVSQMRLRTRLSCSSNPLRKPRRSIALEDINKKFVLPCVMDCKIGTRHYDDDASAEKRRRHIEKAEATTSAKCGVRYTGMQSFKRSTGSTNGFFEFRDKYDGRKLKEHDLIPEATWFFHDNFRVRVDCVRLILDRLCDLKNYLLAQDHFYFYSSSLLLVYEGAPNDVAPPRFDVRMIDFAHTVLSNGNRDDGYMLGINYLIRILSSILRNERDGSRQLPQRAITRDGTNNHVGPTASTSSPQMGSSQRPFEKNRLCQSEERSELQVKASQRPLLSLHKTIHQEVPTTPCHNDVPP